MATSDLIAFLALLLSLVSAWMSFRSGQISARALRLAEEQAQRLEGAIALELIDYESIRSRESGRREYAFRIAVTNQSDSATSLRAVGLAITCSRKKGPNTRYLLSADTRALERPHELRLPASLPSRSTVSGIVFFQLPMQLLTEAAADIESYTVRAIDSTGASATKDALFVNERRNDDPE